MSPNTAQTTSRVLQRDEGVANSYRVTQKIQATDHCE